MTLWNRLKPEHKQTIKNYQLEYKSGPVILENKLKDETIFSMLTIYELNDLFTWTDQCVTEIQWQDLFGDRFLIEEIK